MVDNEKPAEGELDEEPADGEFDARNDVTVILPDDLDAEDDEADGLVAGPDEVTAYDVEETEAVTFDGEEPNDVFVLLPDGDDEEIPVVDTETVDLTEAIPESDPTEEFTSVPPPTASQVGLRSENPTDENGYFEEPTEECLVAEEPTDPIGLGDIDELATVVAEDMGSGVVGEAVDPDDPSAVELHDPTGEFEIEYDEEVAEVAAGGGGLWKPVMLGVAALATVGVALYFVFPDLFGSKLEPAVASSNDSPAAVEAPPVPAGDSAASRVAFEERFRSVVDLAFRE